MGEERKKKAAIGNDEISATLVALERLRSIPAPPRQESITLASAIAKLAPTILDLLASGYSMEMVAERVELGGKRIEAAALKRYLAQHARETGPRRQKRGTTPGRSGVPRLRKTSSATAAETDALNSADVSMEAETKSFLVAPPSKPAQTPSATKGVVEQAVVFQTVPRNQEVKARHTPLETDAASVTPSRPILQTPAVPQPRPPARVETSTASAAQRPPALSEVSSPQKFESGRGQPQLNLLNAATARMNRPPPAGFEEFSGSGSKSRSEPDDPPF